MKFAVPSHVRRVMRMVLYIRAGKLKTRKWEDVSRLPLSRTLRLPIPLLRRFVRLAHRVHVLSHLCLERCLQRCRALGKEVGPPSWAEEQRAILSFWRVQYFYELKIGRLKGRLNWKPNELATLATDRINYNFCGFQGEQVMTAVEFIEEIQAEQGIHSVRPPALARKEFRLPDIREREIGMHPSWQCESLGRTRGRSDSNQVVEVSIAWKYIRIHARAPPQTQLQELPFQPYRKFGVFLWDQKRLTELGLWPDRDILDFGEGEKYFHSWLDLLTPDELAKEVKDAEDNW